MTEEDEISYYREYIKRMNGHWQEIEKHVKKMRFEFNSFLSSKYGKALKEKR